MRLIDADVLIPFIASNYGCDDCKAECGICEIGFVKSDIQCIPTIEAEPIRHGHWVTTATGWIYCSNCDREPPNETNYRSDYCPNCGAKMDEVDEDASVQV